MDDRADFVLDERDRKIYLGARYLRRCGRPASHAGAEAQQTFPRWTKWGESHPDNEHDRFQGQGRLTRPSWNALYYGNRGQQDGHTI
jgi:hypothetical protein